MRELPFWVDLVTAILVVLGALAALIGAFGLVRLPTFYQRIHPPTLGTTVGVWSIAIATVLQFSALEETTSLSAMLIPIFIAMTMPITTIFLMRASLFRDRLAGRPVPPNLTRQANANATPDTGRPPGPDA